MSAVQTEKLPLPDGTAGLPSTADIFGDRRHSRWVPWSDV